MIPRIEKTLPTLSLALVLGLAGCASVEIVRLQPDLLHLPKGTEPVAALQATCAGFYLFTLPIPNADLDCAVNEQLMAKARKLGADRLVQLRFDVTPSHGFWFLTRLLWVRSATAWAIAVRTISEDEEEDEEDERDEALGKAAKPPAKSPQPAPKPPRDAPTSQPDSAPTTKEPRL